MNRLKKRTLSKRELMMTEGGGFLLYLLVGEKIVADVKDVSYAIGFSHGNTDSRDRDEASNQKICDELISDINNK